jgi:hypothetical protein
MPVDDWDAPSVARAVKVRHPGWTYTDITNSPGGETILDTHVNPATRSLVIKQSYNAERDILRNHGQAVKWSDMVMATWNEATSWTSGAVLPHQLRTIVRDTIVTEEAQGAMHNAFKMVHGRDMQPQDELDLNADSPDLVEKAAYDSLSGTVHVDRVIKMLADYPATMRNVRIQSVKIVQGKGHDYGAFSPTYYIVINLQQANDVASLIN